MLDAGIRIGVVYVPVEASYFGADLFYDYALALAAQAGIPVIELEAGDVLTLGGVTVTVLAPARTVTTGSSSNDRSLVLLAEAAGHRILLTGDADGASEPLGVAAQIVQVAHHGSKNAAGEAFLRDARPEVALISVGRNSYGHPHPDTMERLAAAGADVYTTQDCGAVTVWLRRDGINVEAFVK